ncbi:hypothetical protein VFC49_00960 [Thermococcus sp. SY098]|uniref:hypothetical protein n=1 Tax=Thermococcus sp. SY098 TaxID=3111325 RepID=UPI002D76E4D5|nr:hypothetical protein [Thermococcus sp. SY098]WRS52769.1 hypothetical protein VFC49_00960 [Thermococcus sp. SY098]
MQLPKMQPFKENIVSTSKDDFVSLIREALADANGAFIKIFTKDSNEKYYFTVLTDNSKILAAYGKFLIENRDVIGKEALDALKLLLSNPMVIDVYTLDEITLKLSIADNIEIYSATPKIGIEEFLGVPKQSEFSEVLEKEKLLEQVLEKVKREERTKPAPQIEKVKEVKKAKVPEIIEKPLEEKPVKVPKEAPKPASQKVAKKEELKVKIEIIGSEAFKPALEEAFKEYSKVLLNDIKKMNDTVLNEVEIRGEIGTGVVYLTIQLNANVGDEKSIEIAKRKILFFANRHIPVIGRVSGLKPIIRTVKVNVIAGEKVDTMEEKERGEVELWRLKKPPTVQVTPKISLTIDPEFRTYFSAYSKALLRDIEDAGIRVEKMEVEVEGRKEHEINIKLHASAANMSRIQIESFVTALAKKHAREIGKALKKYVWVHKVEVESIMPQQPSSVMESQVSTKAAEILKKKSEIEKEVEKLLKEAGIEELSFLTEDKKKDVEQTLLKSRIEPAMETLKSRVQNDLKLLPRVTFKWLKMNWNFTGSNVEVIFEVSFAKEEVGGLFGTFSGISDDKIKEDAIRTIKKAMEDVSREYGINIVPKRINVLVR